MVPESAMSSSQAHHYHLVFSEQLVKVVLTVVAGMLFHSSLLFLVIHDGFCFFVSDIPLLLIPFPPPLPICPLLRFPGYCRVLGSTGALSVRWRSAVQTRYWQGRCVPCFGVGYCLHHRRCIREDDDFILYDLSLPTS